MSLMTNVKKAVRKAAGRPAPRLLTVKKAWRLTPNIDRRKIPFKLILYFNLISFIF